MLESNSSKQTCEEKARLLNDYQEATQTHSTAVRQLAQTVGNASIPQYERLSKAAEKARYTARDARGLLDLHVSQHGCK